MRRVKRMGTVDMLPASGVNVAVTLYSGWLPMPTGHHSLIASAYAWRVSVTLLSPAGTTTSCCTTDWLPVQAPDTVSVPFTCVGAHRCTRTVAPTQHNNNDDAVSG